MTTTKERAINLRDHEVLGIQAGRQTQLRRIVNPQPTIADGFWWLFHKTGRSPLCTDSESVAGAGMATYCPFGIVGERLWVRREHYRFGHWEEVPGVKTKSGRMKWKFVADTDEVLFDPPESFRKGRHHKDSATPAWHKRLARFMPRSFAGIFLAITNVRVQRLNEISEEDVLAEGFVKLGPGEKLGKAYNCTHGPLFGLSMWLSESFQHGLNVSMWSCSHSQAYRALWESINGTGSWDVNPWVWVVNVKQVQA